MDKLKLIWLREFKSLKEIESNVNENKIITARIILNYTKLIKLAEFSLQTHYVPTLHARTHTHTLFF
jgi:hypothetical protein